MKRYVVFLVFVSLSVIATANISAANEALLQKASYSQELRLRDIRKKNIIPQTKLAMTCFKSGEQISGMNKICYYNCLGSTAAITISAVELCPLNIEN